MTTYFDATPERMVEELEAMKARGNAACIDSKTGDLLDLDEGIKFYRSLCTEVQTRRT